MDPARVPVYQVYANDGMKSPFSEQRAAARWTSGSAPCVYASSHAALALLEYMAHLESSPPHSLCCARLYMADGEIEILQEPPADWKERPYRDAVQQVGDAWLASGRSLALQVPSVVAPASFNLLINPRHARFNESTQDLVEMFRIDSRLM